MTTRRDFIKKTVAGTAALSLGSILPGFGSSRYQDILGANEKIRIGVIGVNSRGKALAQGFAKLPDCEVTYICDVDSRALEKCQAAIHKITGRTPKGEKDIRKMLESNDFEAVVIATPDHWHAKAAIMAMQAGKHVYLEKPTSHNPAENEMLVRAALKYNRIVQVGNQRRSFPNVIKAMEEIKSGSIGKVRYAKSWYVNNRPSIGTGKVVPVPDYLDWDLWQGPAPRVADFKDNFIHYNWHWFWNWGTGEALNNGTHFVDILRWGLGVDYPTKVDSIGGRYRFQDDWQTPDTQLITFQFGDEYFYIIVGRKAGVVAVAALYDDQRRRPEHPGRQIGTLPAGVGLVTYGPPSPCGRDGLGPQPLEVHIGAGNALPACDPLGRREIKVVGVEGDALRKALCQLCGQRCFAAAAPAIQRHEDGGLLLEPGRDQTGQLFGGHKMHGDTIPLLNDPFAQYSTAEKMGQIFL